MTPEATQEKPEIRQVERQESPSINKWKKWFGALVFLAVVPMPPFKTAAVIIVGGAVIQNCQPISATANK